MSGYRRPTRHVVFAVGATRAWAVGVEARPLGLLSVTIKIPATPGGDDDAPTPSLDPADFEDGECPAEVRPRSAGGEVRPVATLRPGAAVPLGELRRAGGASSVTVPTWRPRVIVDRRSRPAQWALLRCEAIVVEGASAALLYRGEFPVRAAHAPEVRRLIVARGGASSEGLGSSLARARLFFAAERGAAGPEPRDQEEALALDIARYAAFEDVGEPELPWARYRLVRDELAIGARDEAATLRAHGLTAPLWQLEQAAWMTRLGKEVQSGDATGASEEPAPVPPAAASPPPASAPPALDEPGLAAVDRRLHQGEDPLAVFAAAGISTADYVRLSMLRAPRAGSA